MITKAKLELVEKWAIERLIALEQGEDVERELSDIIGILDFVREEKSKEKK